MLQIKRYGRQIDFKWSNGQGWESVDGGWINVLLPGNISARMRSLGISSEQTYYSTADYAVQ
jgi:hypothetical protein